MDPILLKALRLLRRGAYTKAIQLLEPEVVRFQGGFLYYYLLGVAYLHSGTYSSAFTYFKLARDIKLQDPSVLLGIAVLYLRRGETDRALDFYLDVQALDEHNKIVKQALDVIRKLSGTDGLSRWVTSGKLRRLFPPLPVAPAGPGRRMLFPVLFLGMALSLSVVYLIRIGVLPTPNFLPQPQPRRAGYELLLLSREETSAPLQEAGTFRYILSESQVLSVYTEALRDFNGHRDERVRRSINRILESNAAEVVKTKARLLGTYLDIPGFDTLKDHFTYGEVKADTDLYRDCYVSWRGMAANIVVEQNRTTFDLLVGYEDKRTLDGQVPVIFDFAAPINPEKPLEVLGRIILIAAGQGQDILLSGVAVEQAGISSAAQGIGR